MTRRFTIRFPDELDAAIKARAKEEGMSVSGFLRRALEEHVSDVDAELPTDEDTRQSSNEGRLDAPTD
jgi:predicted DNA-binding protein